MKKIGIALAESQDWTAGSLLSSVKEMGAVPVPINLGKLTARIGSKTELLAGSLSLPSLDALIVRDLGAGKPEDVSFRFDVLCQLEEKGILVVNPTQAIQRAANKYVSSYLFQRDGLPTPETILTHNAEEAMAAIQKFGKAVIKPVFGYKGIGVLCAREDSLAKIKELLAERGMLYIQRYIPNPGRDIRAFVVNGKVMGAIYRVAPKGSWISNLSRGGRAEPCILDEKEKEISILAANLIGATYAGVDLIEGEDKTYILEINGTPSGKGIYDALGIDVTKSIVAWVLDQI